MTLMMGTWLTMGEWCASVGMSAWLVLTLHGAAMVTGLFVARSLARVAPVGLRMALLLSSGIVLVVSDDWRAMLLAIVLLVIGATDGKNPTAVSLGPLCALPTRAKLTVHAAGAIVLLAVGYALPTQGPTALAMGWWATLAVGLILAPHPNRGRE
jgi:hypothetical protein